jgi:ATP-binding protein involved in chromosome partitioning
VLGVIENMAGFECPDCSKVHDIFGTGGGDFLAEEYGVPVLGRIPLDPAVGALKPDADEGEGQAVTGTGIDLPLIGRLQLPRTREEREQTGSLPPMALRENGGEARERLRAAATRGAARLNQAAVQFDH